MKKKSEFIKSMMFLLVFVFAGLAPLSSAWAATWYVDQTKPTGGNGTTPETAFQKIQVAINAANPGDTVKVSAGTYDVPEGQPGYPQGITISKTLNLEGESPGNTFIEGSSDAIYVSGTTVDINISGFSIRGIARYGIYCNNADSAIIRNVIVCGAGSHGIYVVNTTTDIINCTAVSNGGDGISAYNGNSEGPTSVVNTISAYNGRYGFTDHTDGEEYAQNMCVFSNASGDIIGISSVTGTISANPRLIDLSTCNAQLDLLVSPCKDAGRIGDLDPDGTRADIGAWGGPSAARFWPYPLGGPVITNLSVTPASVPQGGTITITATGEIR